MFTASTPPNFSQLGEGVWELRAHERSTIFNSQVSYQKENVYVLKILLDNISQI